MKPKGKAVVEITLEFFKVMITKGWRVGLGEFVECINGLPEGAEIIGGQLKQEPWPLLELVVEHSDFPVDEQPRRLVIQMQRGPVEGRQVEEELRTYEMLMKSHRAGKLLCKGKTFVAVAVDEPYFQEVYDRIRAQETLIGRWNGEDELCYQRSLAEWREIQERDLTVGRE